MIAFSATYGLFAAGVVLVAGLAVSGLGLLLTWGLDEHPWITSAVVLFIGLSAVFIVAGTAGE